MSEIKVNVKALAYERAHLRTRLSEFVNDMGFMTPEALQLRLAEFYKEVLENVSSNKGITGGDITDRDLAIGLILYGGDIADYGGI